MQIVAKKRLKNVFALINCFGTHGDAVKWLWDVVTMLTNHAIMRGMVSLLHMKYQVKWIFLWDHPRIRGSKENRKMMLNFQS